MGFAKDAIQKLSKSAPVLPDAKRAVCYIGKQQLSHLDAQRKALLQALSKGGEGQTTLLQHRMVEFILPKLTTSSFASTALDLVNARLAKQGVILEGADLEYKLERELRSSENLSIEARQNVYKIKLAKEKFASHIALLQQFFTVTEEGEFYSVVHDEPLITINTEYRASFDAAKQPQLTLANNTPLEVMANHYLIDELMPALWPVLNEQPIAVDLNNKFIKRLLNDSSVPSDAINVYEKDLERDLANHFYLNGERVLPCKNDESFFDFQTRFEAQVKDFFKQHSSAEEAERYMQMLREQCNQGGFCYSFSRLILKAFIEHGEGTINADGIREFRISAVDGKFFFEAKVNAAKVSNPPEFAEPADITSCDKGDVLRRSDTVPLMSFYSKHQMSLVGKKSYTVKCLDAQVTVYDPYIKKAMGTLPPVEPVSSFWEKTKAWANASPARTKAVGVGFILVIAAAIVITSVLTAGAALPIWAIVLAAFGAAVLAGGGYVGATLGAVARHPKTRTRTEDENYSRVAENIFPRVAPIISGRLQSVLAEKQVVNVDLKVVEGPDQAPQVELKISPVVEEEVDRISETPRRKP